PASGWHNSGEVVTVSASANGGSPFSGFGGDLTGTAPSENVSMTAPRRVIASFGPDFVLSTVPNQTASPGQSLANIPLTISPRGNFDPVANPVTLSFPNLPPALNATV